MPDKLKTAVLVIDDYAIKRRLLVSQLRRIGFTDIQEASAGGDALTKLYDRRFGLVLSGWSMRPMSGLDLLTTVRADAQLRGLSFLVVVEEGKEQVEAQIASAVTDYLVKPFQWEHLKTKIESMLGNLAE